MTTVRNAAHVDAALTVKLIILVTIKFCDFEDKVFCCHLILVYDNGLNLTLDLKHLKSSMLGMLLMLVQYFLYKVLYFCGC